MERETVRPEIIQVRDGENGTMSLIDAYIGCPRCGRELSADFSYCPDCGGRIDWDEDE